MQANEKGIGRVLSEEKSGGCCCLHKYEVLDDFGIDIRSGVSRP